MATEAYKRQVNLLLTVLPEVAKEKCFALHGGTAINLFVRNMPRLSVDIDLTYLPLEDRDTSLANISSALDRIKTSIEKVLKGVRITYRGDKLSIATNDADIKLEVNTVKRGAMSTPAEMQLCAKAQADFNAFAVIDVVPIGQLYGGKICAALDRQHPRDLFDVKYLLQNEGFTQEIKEGFLLTLLCGDRPIREILSPNLLDQRSAMENQFTGMADEEFSYEEYEATRTLLIQTVQKSLTKEDKAFLLSVKGLTPDWSIFDFSQFPAIQWKLQNLQKLKDNNLRKYQEQYDSLKGLLDSLT